MTTNEVGQLIKKGRVYATRTKYKEALFYYEKALVLDPSNPETWCLRAAAFIETGRIEEASKDCEHALALNQNYADAWSKKGYALYNLGRFDDAKVALSQRTLGSDELYNYIFHLKELPRNVRNVLERSEDIIAIAKVLKDAKSVFFIGRGVNYPLSLEGALKLKEISYIHAEGFAAGELKHGPFALLTKDTPVVAIVTQDETHEKILANIGEIKARGSPVIAIAEDKDTEIEKHADYVLRFPTSSRVLPCITITVVLQLLAYHVANLRKCPIDKPRNLAKSVTVE